MKKLTKFSLLFFILFYSTMNYGQAHYFSKYNGIPIIAHTNLSAEELILKDSSLSRMRELGIYGIYATDIDTSKYASIINYGLKLFPLQIGLPGRSWVTYYTEGKYSIWEAEGKGNGEYGDTQIDYNDGLAELITNGIITKDSAEAGDLFDGPYTNQCATYSSIDNGGAIYYSTDFKLKLISNVNIDTLINRSNDIICSLRVVGSNPENLSDIKDVDEPLIVRVGDFISNHQLIDSFKTVTFGPYTLTNQFREVDYRHPINEEGETIQYTTEFMRYKVMWSGLSYARLAVDKIINYDERGEELFSYGYAAIRIKNLVNCFKDTASVLGWFGYNEPGYDSYLCFRKVNEIIHEVAPDLDVFTTFTAGCRGRFTWRTDVFAGVNSLSNYPGYEFFKKSGLKYVSINLYNFNYPYMPTHGSDYYLKNIKYVSDSNLVKFVSRGVPISYSTQSGRFYKWEESTCINNMNNFINPSFAQMNYHINLGLLYGAKELTLDPVFSKETQVRGCGVRMYRDGLIDYDLSGTPLTDLGIDFKNTIKPRLSGLFGKTLRKLNRAEQTTGINLRTGNYDDNYIDTVRTNAGGSDTSVVDIGLFSDSSNSDKKYFMLLSRWYNTNSANRYTFLFKTYRNWAIYDYIDSLSRGSLINSNNKGYFEDTISTGDARLYRIYPVVKYGGEINHDETVTSETLTENDLTINSGKTLTVVGTYDCYKNIIVNSGGKLDLRPGSTLNFYNGAKLIVNGSLIAKGKNYNDSLITIDFHGPEATLNCVRLNPGSIDTISYCLIQNGYYGIKADSVEAYISDNEITDCVDGIYVTDSGYMVNGSEGMRIDNNNIHKNAENGISLANSFPLIQGNIITRNSTGVYCEDNSGPLLCNLYDVGLNNIIENDNGLYSYDSSPLLGSEASEFYGYNAVVGYPGAENEVFAIGGSYIMGENCWWGEYPPEKSHFYEDNTSSFDYDPALDYNPFGGSGKVKREEDVTIEPKSNIQGTEGNPGLTTKEKYTTAIKKFIIGDKISATGLLREIISEEPDSAVSLASIRLLMRMAKNETEKDSLTRYLSATANSNENKEIAVYSRLRMAEISGGDYISALNLLLSSYPGTNYKLYIKYKKFGYYLNEKEDKESAGRILSEMTTEYPEHRLTREARKRLGTILSINKWNSEETKGEELTYKLENNYPNPFNPETVIRYQIPVNSKVTLGIYDILGREVARLVDKEQEAGKHEVRFNGSRFSSGVYIYRIITPDYTLSKKLILVK
ncbi:MAG: T9SS type A sorting domain-containing protein [Ignavibacteriaceae bacterium]